MFVAHALRGSGGTRGEQHRGEVSGAAGHQFCFRTLAPGLPCQPSSHGIAGGDPDGDGTKRPAKQPADDLGPRDAHQDAGQGAGDAGEEVTPTHAGVDHHGNGAEFEQSEGRGDERQPLAHHDQRAVAGPYTTSSESGAPGVHLGVEFGEAEDEVVDVAGARAAAGHLDGRLIGLACRHQRQMARDVGGLDGHVPRLAQFGCRARLQSAALPDAPG